MEEIIDEERIKESLNKFNFLIKDIKLAELFLKNINLNKCNLNRLISWLLYLDILPNDINNWSIFLYNIFKIYRLDLLFYIKDNSGIPFYYNQKISELILSDVSRSYTIFLKMINYFNIPIDICNDFKIRISRILIITLLKSPKIEYIQGFDRYAFLSYSLSLKFCLEIGLGFIEAESLSILLLRSLLNFSEPLKFLEKNYLKIQYHIDLDSYLKIHNFDIINNLNINGFFSEHFTTNWIGVLFIETHKINEFL